MYCLVDCSNITNISFAVFVKMLKDKNGDDYAITENDIGFFWHLFVHKIKDYFITYKDIVFCFEGRNSTGWRKSVYPPYKANREERKDNPDYKLIGTCYKQVEEFLSLFHCKTMRVDNCEADDVIYSLSEYLTKKGEEVNIVSSDKDLVQIINYFDGVSVYNPIKKTMQSKDENILLEKAICGDSSDNISGVKGIGQKTLEKMLADKTVWAKKMTPENDAVYKNILKIVDLRQYPKEYRESIIKDFESKDYNKFDKDGVEAFYLKYGLLQCQREWSTMCADIEMMLNGNAEKNAEEELENLLK